MNSLSTTPLLLFIILVIVGCTNAFTTPTPTLLQPKLQQQQQQQQQRISSSALSTSSASSSSASGGAQDRSITPKTFREGEIVGLRLMQDGRHEDALNAFKNAMTLPGSRPDIVRTANVGGPSPVGGSKGGTEERYVQNLDEFEYQAAHYNMACAYACLGNVGESVANLKKAFGYGFDNYATVRADPDLGNVNGSTEFERLMEEVDPRKGLFGMFGK